MKIAINADQGRSCKISEIDTLSCPVDSSLVDTVIIWNIIPQSRENLYIQQWVWWIHKNNFGVVVTLETDMWDK
jgi:hypothetical protein